MFTINILIAGKDMETGVQLADSLRLVASQVEEISMHREHAENILNETGEIVGDWVLTRTYP